jgi:hypothetical protein
MIESYALTREGVAKTFTEWRDICMRVETAARQAKPDHPTFREIPLWRLAHEEICTANSLTPDHLHIFITVEMLDIIVEALTDVPANKEPA